MGILFKPVLGEAYIIHIYILHTCLIHRHNVGKVSNVYRLIRVHVQQVRTASR